ncbi:30S ribosomal protein S18 [Mycoplasma parvum]|uniref:Small ribosomal subunit protein bS18 n=1 Tax=Mycoplasma parvum str. Indiana TaxID=1403316 RepID=U5NBL7_9MOLU|nr:30S ribosomal protein S18 [Mycoplasma parvum]AGX88812.1 hypothetical protein PRV_00110 [Mycoplasma parvum str. Indiana]
MKVEEKDKTIIEENNSTPINNQDNKQEEQVQLSSENKTNYFTRNPRLRRNKKFKKVCWLCRRGILTVDYKDTEFLKNYLKRYNKILIHKISGNCLKHQHQLSQAIKRARYISLLPFVPE